MGVLIQTVSFCDMEEAHSLLPGPMEHPSCALPWCRAGPVYHVVTGMDGPEEFQSLSLPQIFQESMFFGNI